MIYIWAPSLSHHHEVIYFTSQSLFSFDLFGINSCQELLPRCHKTSKPSRTRLFQWTVLLQWTLNFIALIFNSYCSSTISYSTYVRYVSNQQPQASVTLDHIIIIIACRLFQLSQANSWEILIEGTWPVLARRLSQMFLLWLSPRRGWLYTIHQGKSNPVQTWLSQVLMIIYVLFLTQTCGTDFKYVFPTDNLTKLEFAN